MYVDVIGKSRRAIVDVFRKWFSLAALLRCDASVSPFFRSKI